MSRKWASRAVAAYREYLTEARDDDLRRYADWLSLATHSQTGLAQRAYARAPLGASRAAGAYAWCFSRCPMNAAVRAPAAT
jgi:hypothetical protein